MTDRNAETMPPVDDNRVCAPLRNRQRIVDEVERRYGRKAGEMITFAPLVPVENVVEFVIDAVEAMR